MASVTSSTGSHSVGGMVHAARSWLLAGALAAAGAVSAQPAQPVPLAPAPAVAIKPAAATMAAVAAPEDRILVQAWAETETVISSPMVGQLLQIPNRVGLRFEKGENLLAFECTENEARAQIAQSELTAASENLEAKIRLKAMDAASDIEVTIAAAQVAKAEAQLKLSTYQVGQCKVLAPFSGYVVRVMGKPYQTATVGQPMLEIVSAGVPKLRLSASSKWFSRLRVGTALNVRIDETGRSYSAAISAINARIDPVNQSFEMEARIQGGAASLLPGMSGTATLAEAPRAAVPADIKAR